MLLSLWLNILTFPNLLKRLLKKQQKIRTQI
jgi:hypothetical protein